MWADQHASNLPTPQGDVVWGLQLNWCIICLDDIIIFAAIPKEHLKRLQAVLTKLWEAGLKLKPSKCEFLKVKFVYLSHVVSKDGVLADECKIEAGKKWHVPCTMTEVGSFLGFTNYYCLFLKGYVSVVCPLYELVLGDNGSKKKQASAVH